MLFWGSLGADSTEDESVAVLFSEGTSVRTWAYFWWLRDMLSALPGGSWLPSTMTHLCLEVSCVVGDVRGGS